MKKQPTQKARSEQQQCDCQNCDFSCRRGVGGLSSGKRKTTRRVALQRLQHLRESLAS